MIKIPREIERTVSGFAGKARRQLLYPTGNAAEHIANRQAVADEIIPYINRHVDSIIDIGCGLGVLVSILACRFNSREVNLIDGDGSIDVRPNIDPNALVYDRTKPWANVNFASKVVDENCSLSTSVVSHQPCDDFKTNADLIISTRALTYHFPFIQYATRIKRWLPVGGYIFLETKCDVDIIDLAERCGLNLSTIHERRVGKCKLVLCKRC